MSDRVVKLQPSAFTDNLFENGHEGTKLPYPIYVNEDGSVQRQDFWRGRVRNVIGFQRDLSVQQIDLFWNDAREDLDQVVGMYLVTDDASGNFGVHETAIQSATVVGEGQA